MYYITNYDANDRVPQEFYNLNDAKEFYKKLNDRRYVLEEFDSHYNRKIIWGYVKKVYK